VALSAFAGAAAWACSANPTGFTSSTANETNNNNNNNNSSTNGSNSSSGGTSYNSASNNTTYGGETTSTNGGGNTSSTPGGGTTSNNAGATTSTASMVASSTSAVGAAGCGSPAVVCSAPSTAGALTLGPPNCFYTTAASGSGFAYYFGDYQAAGNTCTGSTSCVDSATLCASGMVSVSAPPSYACYGNGFGINLAQNAEGLAMTAPAIKASSFSFSLSSAVPANGMQVQITDESMTQYCAVVKPGTTSPISIPWTSFNTLCYNTPPDGGTINMTGNSLTKIGFQVNSAASPGPGFAWSFCVTNITF
jgi:hypothetical protein